VFDLDLGLGQPLLGQLPLEPLVRHFAFEGLDAVLLPLDGRQETDAMTAIQVTLPGPAPQADLGVAGPAARECRGFLSTHQWVDPAHAKPRSLNRRAPVRAAHPRPTDSTVAGRDVNGRDG
jgi:hypothetical protein